MINVKPFSEEDADALARLYARCYNGNGQKKLAAFRWIRQNPCSVSETGDYLLMFEDNDLLGYWGLMPVTFYLSGKPFSALFSQEALIDPAARGRGLAHVLLGEVNRSAHLVASLWHNNPIVATIMKGGWVNLGHYRPLKKIYSLRGMVVAGWREAVAVKMPSFISGAMPSARRRNKKTVKRYEIERVERCGVEYDDFFSSVAGKLEIISERSSAILNWKYRDIPHKAYLMLAAKRDGRLKGYAVLRVEEQPHARKGIVVDMLADPDEPEALGCLLDACDDIFSRNKVDFAVGLMQREAFRCLFYDRGYFSAGTRDTDCFLVFNQNRTPDPAKIRNLGVWYLTYGESDGDMW